MIERYTSAAGIGGCCRAGEKGVALASSYVESALGPSQHQAEDDHDHDHDVLAVLVAHGVAELDEPAVRLAARGDGLQPLDVGRQLAAGYQPLLPIRCLGMRDEDLAKRDAAVVRWHEAVTEGGEPPGCQSPERVDEQVFVHEHSTAQHHAVE